VIAWWGWLLIWIGLVLLLLGTLAFFGWRLVKRFFALLDDFFALTEKAAILDGVGESDDPRPLNAVLAERDAVRSAFDERMSRRRDIKLARRQKRLERAKIITTAVVNQRKWTS
jgi:hypothetical protein